VREVREVGMADAGADGTGAVATPVASIIEVSTFANYLQRVIPVLLEDVEDTPEGLMICLKERPTVEIMKRFLGDPQLPVLFVQRQTVKGTQLFIVYFKIVKYI